MKLFSNKYLVLIVRIVLGSLFIWSGIMKLIVPPEEFFELARQFYILPTSLLEIYTSSLPWVELIFGLFIVMGFFQKVSAGVITLTLISFMIAIGINIGRGVELDCGCFGSLSFGESLWEVFIRDIVFLVLAVYLFLANNKFLSLDKYFEKR